MANDRYVIFKPLRGKQTYLREGAGVYAKKGDRLLCDMGQCLITVLAPSSIDLPILKRINGGAQTVVRLRVGQIQFRKLRRLSHPDSFLEVIPFGPNSRVDRRTRIYTAGTIFTVLSVGDGAVTTAVAEGKAIVESGGETKPQFTGQGAYLEPGKPPVIFAIDYSLGIEKLRIERQLNKNVVSGCVASGNQVSVEDGKVRSYGDGCFRVVTQQDYVTVANLNGTERRIYFRGVRPFNE
ncbi:MAG: hypothetical protein ACRCYP_01565 [Alphaproteobacteria bacterium]